jgi:hypothetical protein
MVLWPSVSPVLSDIVILVIKFVFPGESIRKEKDMVKQKKGPGRPEGEENIGGDILPAFLLARFFFLPYTLSFKKKFLLI